MLLRAAGVAGALLFGAAVLLGLFASLRETARLPSLSIDPIEHLREFARRGDLDRVLAELDAELRLDPGMPRRIDLWIRSARLLVRLGRPEEAIARFRQALAHDPERSDVRVLLMAELAALGRSDEVLPEYEQLLARMPNDATLRSNHAYALARVGDLEGALREYTRAYELAPDLVQASFGLGRLLLLLERPADAIEPLERAAAARPELAGSFALLGRAQRELSRDALAIETYRKALELEPRLFGARVALAHLLVKVGRRDEAVAEMRRALAGRPDDPVLLNNLAWLLATAPALAPGAAEEAVALAERASARDADAEALDTLAAALAAAGRYEEARTSALRALHLAREQGDLPTAEGIAARLKGYSARKRHVERPPTRASTSGEEKS